MHPPSWRPARLSVLSTVALVALAASGCESPSPPMPASPLVIPVERPATSAPPPAAVATAPPTAGPVRAPAVQVVEEATAARPALVLAPAGVFLMGSRAGQRERASDERLHRVELSRPFLVTTTEITQGNWERLMGNNPSFFHACGPDCPVDRVNWYEAIAFANALSASEGRPACYTTADCSGVVGAGCAHATGRRNWCLGDYRCREVKAVPGCTGYRLPTEAEWEYAGRAGDPGNRDPEDVLQRRLRLGAIAWYADNSLIGYGDYQNCNDPQGVPSRCGPTVGGRLRPNAWGLYDMLGNVAEWCEDAYDAEYPPGPLVVDPLGTGTGPLKVTRGGSWFTGAAWIRLGLRDPAVPLRRSHALGFRLVRRA